MTSGSRTTTALTGSLLLGMLLGGCGGGSEPDDLAAATPEAEQSEAAPTEASPQTESAGAVVSVPPSCEDAEGDSSGALDLTSVTVFRTPEAVIFGYTYSGTLPTSGSLLFVASDGSKQYGYKLVDGQESSHFIFDFSNAKQENVEEDVQVGASETRVSFARDAVDVTKLTGATATISVDGSDIDECQLE